MTDLAAVVSVEALEHTVLVRVVAAGQSLTVRLGVDVALVLADDLTIAAHRPLRAVA